jgi:uncharacterized BrkB/YihY/UPF0761 family membrane protein
MGLQGTHSVNGGDPSVEIIGQAVNAVIATVLWAYLASIAILLGGEFNATLRRRRAPVEAADGTRFERAADVPATPLPRA